MAASEHGWCAATHRVVASALEPAGIHWLAPGPHVAPGVDDAFPLWMRLCSDLPLHLRLPGVAVGAAL